MTTLSRGTSGRWASTPTQWVEANERLAPCAALRAKAIVPGRLRHSDPWATSSRNRSRPEPAREAGSGRESLMRYGRVSFASELSALASIAPLPSRARRSSTLRSTVLPSCGASAGPPRGLTAPGAAVAVPAVAGPADLNLLAAPSAVEEPVAVHGPSVRDGCLRRNEESDGEIKSHGESATMTRTRDPQRCRRISAERRRHLHLFALNAASEQIYPATPRAEHVDSVALRAATSPTRPTARKKAATRKRRR